MSNLARKLSEHEVFQTMGTITRSLGSAFVVRSPQGDLHAKRAVSCLVEPADGDYVLVAGDSRGAAYILGVLERGAEHAATAIHCEGDLEIQVPNGKLRIASQEGIEMLSAKDVNIAGAEVSVHARTASVVVEQLSYLGSLLVGELGKLKVKSGIIETVAERVSARVKRSFRSVEEVEQLKAECIDYAANQTMTLRAENTIVTAKELVKMDGEQIHMG